MEGMESCDLPEYKAVRDSDFFKPFLTALPHILDKAVTKIGKYLETSNRKVIDKKKLFSEGGDFDWVSTGVWFGKYSPNIPLSS